MRENVIPSTCDCPSAFIHTNEGYQLHYLHAGQTSNLPVVFLHGVPTYSYTWRNIIPHLSSSCYCIALDLLGFGFSDKPDIQYDLKTYQNIFEQFIEKLNLDKMILVMHGFGSVIGFDYAVKHPEKVKGIAFMESHLRATTKLNDLSLPVQEIIMSHKQNDPNILKEKILQENIYIEKILPAGVLRQLTETEMDYYRKPFPTPASRKAIWDFVALTPYLNNDEAIIDCINQYSEKLTKSHMPKLMLYALPGFIGTMSSVQWAKAHLPNVKLADIGEALHIPQETHPQAIGQALREWMNEYVT